MEFLYAPWREKYIHEKTEGKRERISVEECIFCAAQSCNDADSLILYRAQSWFVMVNKFPYNAGHILIVSCDHQSSFTALSREVQHELNDIVHVSLQVLEKVLEPEGFNIGMNLGKIAGAGIPSHIHQHIVPRWQGDTNFLPVIAQTKHISSNLVELYKQLKLVFSE